MPASVEIISVGTLSRNRFWNEQGEVRASHATTSLIRDDTTSVIVDPSLPGELLSHRLDERVGLKPEQVEVVFLTNFRPIHRRGIHLFDHATWLMSAEELDAMHSHLNDVSAAADARGEPVDELVEQELALLGRFEPAPEKISSDIHLFPSPGVTPGSTSLLGLTANRTLAVTGDSIINQDYFAHRRVFEQHSNAEAAVQAMAELMEIADIIVPGHGDWILNF
jgi:glyoxylase-like metal-dependent hydrolase (beta-lactamase superfamily II)